MAKLTTKLLDMDVVEAARMRIRHIYDTFDDVAVCFSGGKDSLVCLHLAKELHEERGLGPVKVIFRDEEIINRCVIDFVNEYRQKDWVQLGWFCVPLKSERVILDKRYDYIQWDEHRENIECSRTACQESRGTTTFNGTNTVRTFGRHRRGRFAGGRATPKCLGNTILTTTNANAWA